jgi:formylglycine-generating enzyme required for sulfatase activity
LSNFKPDSKIPMIDIPAGEILMRDDRIDKIWNVQVEAFQPSPVPVTQKLYHSITNLTLSAFEGPDHPVENVTWIDAIAFCNQLSLIDHLQACYIVGDIDEITFNASANGYRLSVESEWEYACRAGSKEARYGPVNQIAWCRENSGGTTHDVASLKPNAWGNYDMLGNVWEWCSDIYDESVYGSYRIIRGGGWADEARRCLAINRRRSHPASFKIDDLGFRIARNLETPIPVL